MTTRHQSSVVQPDIDDFLAAEVQRLAIAGVPVTVPSVTQFSHNMVAKDVYQTSPKDRDLAMQEIHGVADQIDETPALVEESLRMLEVEIQRRRRHMVSSPSKLATTTNTNNNNNQGQTSSASPSLHAYDRAVSIDPEFVQSVPFRLSFLRADRFDPEKAAERFLLYLEYKEYLFGTELLTKPVRMADLDNNSRARLECGYFQILPRRDLAGRAVFACFGTLQRKPTSDDEEIRSELRVLWKLMSIAIEDEETQKKGTVFVTYYIGGMHLPTRKLLLEFGRLNRTFPLRLVSHHACVDNNPLVEALINFSVLLTGPFVTVRHRCHRGSNMEVQYKLMTFGIPSQLLPVDVTTGEIDLSWHEALMRQRWIQESSNPPTVNNVDDMRQNDEDFPFHTPSDDGIVVSSTSCHWWEGKGGPSLVQTVAVVPSEFDITFGRGKGSMKHPGNARFRDLIETHRERYEQAKSKGEKSCIIREVVMDVLNSGRRFLKQEANGEAWVAVGPKDACIKVSHAFRNQKRGPVSISKMLAAVSEPNDAPTYH